MDISGALYVDQETDEAQRSSAQGLFMVMTNGLGATIGTLAAQRIVNLTVPLIDKTNEGALGVIRDAQGQIDWANIPSDALLKIQEAAGQMWAGWQEAWYIFAGFALVVSIAFWIFFPKTPVSKDIEIKH